MALKSVEKTLEAQLVEDVKKIEGIKSREVEVRIQPNGKTIDVTVYPPALSKYPKMHFWERKKELLPGVGLDFTEKTATASVTVRYRIGLSPDEHRLGSWKASGTTFPVLDMGDDIKKREEDAANLGKKAIERVGWVAEKAFEVLEKDPSNEKSELFLSRVSTQLRESTTGIGGKRFESLGGKFESLAPVINASKRTVHMQLVDYSDEPQMSLHFTKDLTWADVAVEYNIRLTQKEDGTFTVPKRDLSDAALELHETQAVNAAKKVLAEVEKTVRNYFEAVESRKD